MIKEEYFKHKQKTLPCSAQELKAINRWNKIVTTLHSGAGETDGSGLRAPAALGEDWSLVPATYTMTQNHP